ncbi:MAG: hypothetical protein GY950_10610, partial [bacterium]|nr:hypothetical protein [bacterium]
ILVIVASAGGTILYILDVNRFKFRFWYQEFINNQDKILSSHGYYYLIMSFILMAISFAVVAAHFELFSVSSQIGKSIEEKLKSKKKWNFGEKILSKEEVIKMFSPFSSLHIVSKILVVSYLANIYTWKMQMPNFTGMLDVTIIALAVLGTAVVSYPKYHVQYYIFKIWKKNGINEYPEIRSPIQIGLSSLADFLILGGAMTNLIAYVLKKSDVNLTFF